MGKLSGIYKIESKYKHEKFYIGSSINIYVRWKVHISELRRNVHRNSKLQNHFNKYGESDLLFSILLICDEEDLIKTEQYFINFTNPFFNICKTAGSCLGVKASEETRRKLSKSLKGRKPWNKGLKGVIKDSDETKGKKSISHKGKRKPPLTLEQRKNMSNSHIKHGKYVHKDLA